VDVRAARVGEVVNAGQPIVTLINTVLYFPSGAVYPQQGFPG
jgi:multidrug resistance efflux pump